MKTIILMRHSIPMKKDLPTEEIPLSSEGKELAQRKRNTIHADRCFCSPYLRAYETALFFSDAPQIIEDLHERTVGDADHDFWLQQYEDHDYKNLNGESLNEVKERMDRAVQYILDQMQEGETALAVSHATAICAYLLNSCEIRVNDPKEKTRRILFHDEIIMNGKIDPMNFFVLCFDHGTMTGISFHH
jgi:2,3-bisphosphoglycerate-dependent phosphoglycerate mutase